MSDSRTFKAINYAMLVEFVANEFCQAKRTIPGNQYVLILSNAVDA